MKITLESQASIESIRNILASSYFGQFEAAISATESLLEHVIRRQQPPLADCSSDGCDHCVEWENCSTVDQDAGLIKNNKLAAKLNEEMEEVEKWVREELIDIDILCRRIELDEFRKKNQQLLRENDSLPN